MRISRSFRRKTAIEGVGGRKKCKEKLFPQKNTGRNVLKIMEKHRENKKNRVSSTLGKDVFTGDPSIRFSR